MCRIDLLINCIEQHPGNIIRDNKIDFLFTKNKNAESESGDQDIDFNKYNIS